MKKLKRQKQLFAVVFLIGILLSGCGSRKQVVSTTAPEDSNLEVIAPEPEPGKAMIVFYRPSVFAMAIRSAVFEIKDGEPVIAARLYMKNKVAYQVEPGEHLFMVIAESADFMSAEVEAGKTYYAMVVPRMGAWKARFSFDPIHADEMGSKKYFSDGLNSCQWLNPSPEWEQWAEKNMKSILSKNKKFYKKWMAKAESDRPKLFPEDGK